ncbi:MAG: acyl-CoA dehydrogenase family protein [bacterium]|nr:acyl-CoA dehydrogenase family protein [bacterium]MDE0668698.1 acyl-CoA dehydrogenase family protein [bacterium]MXZ29872.1 acyl-CoA dehydrogenase [Acidimicrobiia bacterium]MYJ14531.1 acyl-CoA dehydrogenase [Acidimicrobiia bacterium]
MSDIGSDRLRDMARQLLADVPVEADMATFRGEQFDRGLACVHFPVGRGGLGLEPEAQAVVDEELAAGGRRYQNISVNPIGIGMGMPTVLAHGTDEMQDRLLRPCFCGEEIWCQLFSEPGAGSDVAGLATRAVLDGEEWIVDGQKVWTTLAHVSRWGLLLARTEPEQPKHKGMTYFMLDMQAAGVEVRPLHQITGEAEFNEVFMTNVRIPDSMRLGARGGGWGGAITTLMNERVALGGEVPPRGSGSISTLANEWSANAPPGGTAAYHVARDRVTQLWIRAELLRLTNRRAREAASAGLPGPEGAVGKLLWAELNKEILECAVDVRGSKGMVHAHGYPKLRPEKAGVSDSFETSRMFLRARANSIEGGTSEIMRNILGERVLGLPKEPQVDREIPWSTIPRN